MGRVLELGHATIGAADMPQRQQPECSTARRSGAATRRGWELDSARPCQERESGPNQFARVAALFKVSRSWVCEHTAATWLSFRRTCSSWSHDKGVPEKVVAQLMGHADVNTTLNVYTQGLDGAVREAVEKVGGELFTIVHKPEWVAAKSA